MENKIKELEKELREFFPKADIHNYGTGISIKQDTFYSIDRREIIRLEEKYKAGVWCDVRSDKVHYHFHGLGMWKA